MFFDQQEISENSKKPEHEPRDLSQLSETHDKFDNSYQIDENNRRRVIFEDKFSLHGRTYGSPTFEAFAREGSPKYQDLWLRNPQNPFAATNSVHSLSQNISEKLERDTLRTRLSSCINLTKKTSGFYNTLLTESQQYTSSLYDNFSNHASASSSVNKLSDISTPKQSLECLRNENSKTKLGFFNNINRYYDSDISNCNNNTSLNNFSRRVNRMSPPGNKLLFKSTRRGSEGIEKSTECLEKIRKCLEDLNV